jgi:hypothetical protein
VYFNIRIYFLEIIKVNDFSKDYENLKNQIDGDKGKLIGFLFVGLIIGRIYEKLRFTKKKIFRRFK